ncbi:ARS-binding factor 2, mitochondrial-like [Anopheles albimanus]|uniref:ARS-binding factor 2, mitochondrial-like n=1 Tax=Anopheles albimanus TaxID=7167 RepID=UPI0016421DE5|nr:ARS-binding factor 2, mitochondrial-like [Anopheles albimanus]
MQLNSLIKLFNVPRLLLSSRQNNLPLAAVATQSNGFHSTVPLENATAKAAAMQKPKRPVNAYIRYAQSIRADLAKANPSASQMDLAKLTSAKWQTLDQPSKARLEEEYKRELAVWLQQNAKYLSQLTDVQKEELKQDRQQKAEDKAKRDLKRTLKQLGRPKRPINGFLRFCAQFKPKSGVTQGEHKEQMRALGEKWRSMSASEKEQFNREADEAIARYQEEMKQWEDKMLAMDNGDLVRRKNALLSPAPTPSGGKARTTKKEQPGAASGSPAAGGARA